MLKSQIIKKRGDAAKIAKIAGVSRAAVSNWKEVIPELRAYKIKEYFQNENQDCS